MASNVAEKGWFLYLPDDGSGTLDEPSERFINIQKLLQEIGLDASWAYKYNAGSNPIGIAVPREFMENEKLKSIMQESYSLT